MVQKTQPNQSPKRGFAGFGTLASDVDNEIAAAKLAAAEPPSGPSGPAGPAAQVRPHDPTTALNQGQVLPGGPKPVSESRGVWWVIIGIVALIAWKISTHEETVAPAPVGSAPIASAKVQSPPSSWDEARPSEGGGDRVLNFSELRYCVAEDIRLQAMDAAIDRYEQYEVDGFNNFVKDYNARCGSFKYRSGSLQSVQSDAANRRGTFEEEGRLRVLAFHPAVKTTRPQRNVPTGASPVHGVGAK